MSWTRREFLSLASAGAASVGLAACSTTPSRKTGDDQGSHEDGQESPSLDLSKYQKLALDMSAWHYDSKNDVYYQLGLDYCLSPATSAYESLAIFVPGAYFKGERSGDKYRCTINDKGIVGTFTPATAPILMPINTGTLSPQASPTRYGYEGLGTYLNAGCIYVYAGFRGRSAGYDSSSDGDRLYPGGAPWPAVDLKAAVRYLRYNSEALPCDTSRVFVFGFSAGGGLSAVLGSSGDAPEYKPYLESIGAVEYDAQGKTVSDAVFGSASWCPQTSYDIQDSSYEWMMGQYFSTGTRAAGTFTAALSQGLAGDYASYVNSADFRDDGDDRLTLDETEGSVYALGSYAHKMLSIIEDSATRFMAETSFPYTYTPQHLEDPSFPGDPNLATNRASEAAVAAAKSSAGASSATDAAAESTGTEADGTGTTDSGSSASESSASAGTRQVQSTIFDTPQDYLGSLNAGGWWIYFNVSRQTVSISSLRDFVTRLRQPARAVPAFDALDRSTKSNQLFGVGEESTLHFDKILGTQVEGNADSYASLEGWKRGYASAWTDDLGKTDAMDNDVLARVNMFNPLYYLSGVYGGYGSASVAPHWRINDGAFDGETSLCTSANLMLALKHYDGVTNVDYQAVWGQGHVLAERSGAPVSNLLAWVVSCCQSS